MKTSLEKINLILSTKLFPQQTTETDPYSVDMLELQDTNSKILCAQGDKVNLNYFYMELKNLRSGMVDMKKNKIKIRITSKKEKRVVTSKK